MKAFVDHNKVVIVNKLCCCNDESPNADEASAGDQPEGYAPWHLRRRVMAHQVKGLHLRLRWRQPLRPHQGRPTYHLHAIVELPADNQMMS